MYKIINGMITFRPQYISGSFCRFLPGAASFAYFMRIVRDTHFSNEELPAIASEALFKKRYSFFENFAEDEFDIKFVYLRSVIAEPDISVFCVQTGEILV